MDRIEVKNSFVKAIVYIFFFLLKRKYLIYKDGDKIVLLKIRKECGHIENN